MKRESSLIKLPKVWGLIYLVTSAQKVYRILASELDYKVFVLYELVAQPRTEGVCLSA